ncbi:hypothetical protein L9F63_005392, partial [Diploptera punctata]
LLSVTQTNGSHRVTNLYCKEDVPEFITDDGLNTSEAYSNVSRLLPQIAHGAFFRQKLNNNVLHNRRVYLLLAHGVL